MEVNKKRLLHTILAFIGMALLISGYFIYDNKFFTLLGRLLMFFNLFMVELIEYKEKTKIGEKKSIILMIFFLIFGILAIIDIFLIILAKK